MALLQKLFQSKKNCVSGKKWSQLDTSKHWKRPKFDPSNIRLVIYGDNDTRGRQLLFDSKAVKRMEDLEVQTRKQGRSVPKCSFKNHITNKFSSDSSHAHGPKYQFQKPGSDIVMLEEMMFGSIGLAHKGDSLKVHIIKSPPQLMLTKVFIPERPKRESGGEVDSDSCSFSSQPCLSTPKLINQNDIKMSAAHSVPVDVPSPKPKFTNQVDIIDEDSGLASMASSGSFQTLFPSPGSNTSSYNSLKRRMRKYTSTSLEGCCKSLSSRDFSPAQEASPARRKRSKVALGILIGLSDDEVDNKLFESFFFSHITLFESHLEKLRRAVARAYYNKRSFTDILMEAISMFRSEICDLYTAPRLSEPVWLNMMSYSSYRYVLCEQFMAEFMSLVSKYENKNTRFFFSSLITAVLTHHLAWVPTVTPAGGAPSRTYLDKHSAKWVDTLAKTHPYNPLWAQLGDLYGTIGFPTKLARTVVIGKKAELVKKILYILSYFIRCSDVHENSEWGSISSCLDELVFEDSPSEMDKGEITPIQEVSTGNFAQTYVADEKCEKIPEKNVKNFENEGFKYYVESENKKNSTRSENINKNTDSSEDLPHVGGSMELLDFHKYHVSNESSNDYSSDKENSYCDKKLDSSKNGSTSSIHSMNEIVLPPNGVITCKLKKSRPSETYLLENNQLLRQAVKENLPSSFSHYTSFRVIQTPPDTAGSNLVRSKSLLSQQLEGDSRDMKATIADIKRQYLKEGSNSLFDEYFDGTETKTIDDVAVKDRVVNHPLMKSPSSFQSSTTDVKGLEPKTPYLNNRLHHKVGRQFSEVSTSAENLSENKNEKRIRHWSFGHALRPQQLAGLKDGIGDNLEHSGHAKRLGSFSNATRPGDLSMSGSSEFEGRHGSFSHGIRPRKQLARQGSFDKVNLPRQNPHAPGRCRPVTPTELGRRRHASSTSSQYDADFLDPMANCKDIVMPRISGEMMTNSIKAFDRNFGRSLLAEFSDHYLSDFVLHGTSDQKALSKIVPDLQMALQHSVLDEPISEAVCIVADTDKWTVEVASTQHLDKSLNGTQPCVASQLVFGLLESVLDLWKLKMSPEFCLMHLEDRLQEIFFKSKMLAEYLDTSQRRDVKELADMLGFDTSDLPLLVAIAGTHSPQLSLGLVP
ncbi:hypothetical protein ScPMuIL_004940 [Solemya velum]